MKYFILFICLLSFSLNNSIAQFVFEEEENNTQTNSVQPPINNAAPEFSNYSVKATEATTLNHSTGTKIIVPPNAFVNAKGNIVKGNVDLKFREYTNPLDIFLSGIPMTVDQNGKKEFFQSAGMIEIRASQKGEPVFPNPDGDLIAVEMTSNQLGEDFQFYTLEEETGEWIEEGTDSILWNSKEVLPNVEATPQLATQNNNENFNLNAFPPPIAPSLKIEDFHIAQLRNKKNTFRSLRKVQKHRNLLQFRIEGTSKGKGRKVNKNTDQLVKYFSGLYQYRKAIWFYEGKNKREVSTLINSINKANESWRPCPNDLKKFIIKDLVVELNPKQDNYKLKFICADTTVYIEAYPYVSSSNPSIIQKRNLQLYKKYKKSYSERCKEWKKLEDINKKEMEDFEVRMAAYMKMISEKDVLSLLTARQLRNGATRRRIDVFSFGICNIDRIMNRLDTELLVDVKDQNGDQVEYYKIAILDVTNNASLTYANNETIRFDERATNNVMIIMKDGSSAIINSNDFQKAFKDSSDGYMKFTIKETFNESDFNKKTLSDALANN